MFRQLLIIGLVLAAAGPLGAGGNPEIAEADETAFWRNPRSVKVRSDELAFTDRNFDFAKNDSIFFQTRFNDGWVLMLSFFRIKAFLIDRWGIYAVVSEPDGTAYWAKYQMKNRDVSYDTERLYISDGRNTVQGNRDSFRVQCDIDGFACDLVFENILPPWKPGDGVDYYTPDGRTFQFRVISSPWARVSGTLTIGGKTVSVKGDGFGEKALIVCPLSKLNPYTYSLRLYSPSDVPQQDRWHIEMLESVMHDAHGGHRIPRLAIAKGSDWLLTTRDYSLTPSAPRKEGELPFGYPGRLRLELEADGYSLTGEYTARKLFNYTDVLDEIPPEFRSLVSAFMKRPVYFRCLGEFKGRLTLPDGTVEDLHLFGPYEYVVAK